jgi:hypothetical protein
METLRRNLLDNKMVINHINHVECHFIAATIGEEYFACFSFGHCSVFSVIVDAHRFKRAPSSIVY